jgi:hypothetical protein
MTKTVADTPVRPSVSKFLSVAGVAATVVTMLSALPEKDANGRDHSLSWLQRALKSAYRDFWTVSDEERAAVHAQQSRTRNAQK